ncbi:hypothetical protein ACHQM5_013839 [Ranunculus cassubicifolius]
MPQDLETILRGTGSGGDGRDDGRVTCETLFNSDHDHTPPDFPPESYYISKEDERDWFDRNVFFDRKESINKTNLNNPSPNPKSSRSQSKSKQLIIGLPKIPDSKSRRCGKPANTRFFPKRLGSGGKFSLRLSEPSSPKVSCMGKVRSRNRSCRRRSMEKKKPTKKTGFWLSFKKIFGLSCRKTLVVDVGGPPESSRSPEKKVVEEKRGEQGERTGGAPGLGGMNRFVSGRRSDSWAGEALSLGRVQEYSDRCTWGPTTVAL